MRAVTSALYTITHTLGAYLVEGHIQQRWVTSQGAHVLYYLKKTMMRTCKMTPYQSTVVQLIDTGRGLFTMIGIKDALHMT